LGSAASNPVVAACADFPHGQSLSIQVTNNDGMKTLAVANLETQTVQWIPVFSPDELSQMDDPGELARILKKQRVDSLDHSRSQFRTCRSCQQPMTPKTSGLNIWWECKVCTLANQPF